MQRLILALAAFTSLFMMNMRPLEAQETETKSVEPTAQPQEINKRVENGSAPMVAPTPPPASVFVSGDNAWVIEAGETKQTLHVENQTLVVRGEVRGDIHASHSAIVVEPGGKVDGTIFATDTTVNAQPDQPVRVEMRGGTAQSLGANMVMIAVPNRNTPAVSRNSWFGAQFGLLVAGLIGAGILALIAPRATGNVAGTAGDEKARSLIVGGLAALALGVLSFFNAGLMHSPVRVLWSPFGFVVATIVPLVMAFGWLSGMRLLGDGLAARSGNTQPGSLFGRTALGLTAFFLLNCLLGMLHLDFIGLIGQAVFALLGLGAAFITGFGTQSNWLGARMSGSPSWGSWKSRP